jgi:hypothetical protein
MQQQIMVRHLVVVIVVIINIMSQGNATQSPPCGQNKRLVVVVQAAHTLATTE